MGLLPLKIKVIAQLSYSEILCGKQNNSNKFIKRSFLVQHKWPSSNHLQEMYVIWWYRRTWATIY